MENKKDKLFLEAIIKFSLGVIIVGLLIFIPAGSILYVQGWIFMGILFIPMFIAGLFMIVKNPELLKSRLDAKENEKDQSLVVKLSGLMFLIGFIVSGLNFRFQWYILPFKASIIAVIIFLLSYLLYAEVLRENTYLSRTIKVQKNQIVIYSKYTNGENYEIYSR